MTMPIPEWRNVPPQALCARMNGDACKFPTCAGWAVGMEKIPEKALGSLLLLSVCGVEYFAVLDELDRRSAAPLPHSMKDQAA